MPILHTKDWKDVEKDVASSTGGRRQAGSGSPWGVTGDVEVDRSASPVWWDGIIWECKHTRNKSFSIGAKTWHKVWSEAAREGKLGAMAIQIDSWSDPNLQPQLVAVVDYYTLVALLDWVQRLEVVLQDKLLGVDNEKED